jgi:hypothetical protein
MRDGFTCGVRVLQACAAGLCITSALLLNACSGEEIIVKTADGQELSAADIDKEPLSLLPPGLAVANVSTLELFNSSLGNQLVALAESQLPIPASANFNPRRDLKRLFVAVYSAAGVDFAGVAVGKFDPKAIEAAAARSEVTPLGTPLVTVKYSKWTFYVSANLGFCVLTPNTVLFGNEVGIRRALDRLERGDLTIQLHPDVEALLRTPGAPIAIGATNLNGELDPFVQKTPLAANIRVVRAIADLKEPGSNFAGTFTYADESAAAAAKEGIDQTFTTLDSLSTVGALFGLRKPVRSYATELKETSVQVAVSSDTVTAEMLLSMLNGLLGQRAATSE